MRKYELLFIYKRKAGIPGPADSGQKQKFNIKTSQQFLIFIRLKFLLLITLK